MHILLPEWHPQEAIILAWPDHKTDWAPWLPDVQHTYIELIRCITENNTCVIMLVRNTQALPLKAKLTELSISKVLLVVADYNDTWVRDYGFLTCSNGERTFPVDYQFNGWGQKFNATKDNSINQIALASLCIKPLTTYDLVVEGGALEIDAQGHLLSTKLCLTNPRRNGDLAIEQYQSLFTEQLGAKRVSIFTNGHLEGDDTDGHIDTLVRFTPDSGLVIQSAFNRPEDSHYAGLHALVNEVQEQFPQHNLFELPLPFIENAEGERLPASYANFLISNKQIIAPIYQQKEDELALTILRKAYPNHKIHPVNSLPLVQQFGSIHCISMQVPVGTIKPNILFACADGVTLYEH